MNNKKPLSGLCLVDWHFIEIVNAIENVLEKIYLKKVLKDTTDHRKRLLGYLGEDHKIAFIAHEPPDAPAVRNLLHEALHVTMPYVSERRIRVLEENLWQLLTDNQKKYLRKKVPKHHVKKEPGAT